jgi:acyl CoA:acetate/3-ketoacid CoA transferase
MKNFNYHSGQEIRIGDRISYHGESGKVDFVVTEKTGRPEMDWYIEQDPEGGVMLTANGFGNVFLTEANIDEDLDFISRGDLA